MRAALAACGDWSGGGSAEHALLVSLPGANGGQGCVALLEPSSPGGGAGPRACLADVLTAAAAGGQTPGPASAAGFGSSLAYLGSGWAGTLGARAVAVGAPQDTSPANPASQTGSVWLLGLSQPLGVTAALRVDSSGLGLSTGDRFGSAIAVISTATGAVPTTVIKPPHKSALVSRDGSTYAPKLGPCLAFFFFGVVWSGRCFRLEGWTGARPLSTWLWARRVTRLRPPRPGRCTSWSSTRARGG